MFTFALLGVFALLPSLQAASIPRASIKTPSYEIGKNWNIHARPTTRTFDFTLSSVTGSPDGIHREMRVINGQYPGPLIEANEGDTIVVNLHNALDIGNSLHFHGINQNGSNWADGPVGVTQCPVPAGTSYTYQFTITEQYGTFWWHSHMGNTLADGILGPLVVHSPNDPYAVGKDYDFDRLIMLTDWQDVISDIITDDLRQTSGYLNETSVNPHAAPNPDSLLINGVGTNVDCSYQYNPPFAPDPNCKVPAPPEIQVVPNSRYRFRVLNYASHAHIKFSIDNHAMKVIAVDSWPVTGPSLTQLPIGMAERYDVIVNTNAGKNGDAFYARNRQCTLSVQFIQPNYNPLTLAVFRYVQPGTKASTRLPVTNDWPGNNVTSDTFCHDIPYADLVPIGGPQVPKTVIDHKVWYTLGVVTSTFFLPGGVGHFFWNGVTYDNHPFSPMLHNVHAGIDLNSTYIPHAVFNGIGGADIALSNTDPTTDHPYHLHSRSFWIVASGAGNLTEEAYLAMPQSAFNLDNPLHRDTLVIPRGHWAVIRIVTDIPGVWALHCHIGWHQVAGKLAAVVIQPKAIQATPLPSHALELCNPANFPPGITADSRGP